MREPFLWTAGERPFQAEGAVSAEIRDRSVLGVFGLFKGQQGAILAGAGCDRVGEVREECRLRRACRPLSVSASIQGEMGTSGRL